MLQTVTWGYRGLTGETALQGVTGGYITEGYKGLQGVTRGYRGYKELQKVTRGSRGLQEVTGG